MDDYCPPIVRISFRGRFFRNFCAHLILFLQEKFEWIEEPVDRTIKQGLCDEVSFSAKLSHKGKKAKWYLRNQVGLDLLGGLKKTFDTLVTRISV